jgi:hypothetical protein
MKHTFLPALLAISLLASPARAQITAANWTQAVGFAPDLAQYPEFKPGEALDSSNWSRVEKWVPAGLRVLVEKYKLVLTCAPYQSVHPSLGYVKATEANRGKARVDWAQKDPRTGALSGYQGGLPFPRPFDEPDPARAGRLIAYNNQHAYAGDDGGFHYGVFWVSAKSGVERSEEWRWRYITRTRHRTDVEPIPSLSGFDDDVASRSMTWAVYPQDKRGFAALYTRFQDPRDVQGWIYLPTMRRVLRATFGTRGDAWNSTDLLYEDVRGYNGYAEWMEWRLVERRTMLAPVHSGLVAGKEKRDAAFDFDAWPHWNPRMQWEPRPVYVLEATPRFPDYPYSRMTFYVDAETSGIVFKEMYDKKGQLWKVLLNASSDSPDLDRFPLRIGTALVVDLQAEHATVFPAYKVEANVGHDPDFFSESNLRKMGK